MKKLLTKILVALVVIVVVLLVCRNFIARKAVEVGVKTVTGFPLTIGSVDLGLFSGALEVDNLKLMNPPEFKEPMFVDMPLFKVDYVTRSMLSGTPHIKVLDVNVKEVTIVKNAQGESNATVLQNKVSPPAPAGEKPAAASTAEKKKQAYRVDLVKVHIGTVVTKDYSKGATPSVRTMNLNQDVVVRDLSESTSITAIVMRTMLGPVGNVAGGLVQDVGGVAKQAGETLQKTGKGLFDSLKKAIPQK